MLELLGDAVLDVTLWGPWRQPLRAIATPPQHKLHARVAANKSSPVSPAPVIPMSESMADPTAPPLSLDEIRQVCTYAKRHARCGDAGDDSCGMPTYRLQLTCVRRWPSSTSRFVVGCVLTGGCWEKTECVSGVGTYSRRHQT